MKYRTRKRESERYPNRQINKIRETGMMKGRFKDIRKETTKGEVKERLKERRY